MLPDHGYGASVSRGVSVYLRNLSLMGYYSFNRPQRDGWLSWPCWLSDSGCFTRKVVTRPAVSLAQDRESLSARTGGLTTVLRHQLVYACAYVYTKYAVQCCDAVSSIRDVKRLSKIRLSN